MLIIGCDYHPSFQQIALVNTESGELQERRLGHREEAEQFYRALATAGAKVRVGMEASGHAGWFERLLAELNFELWMGDAAKIAAKRVRKQKTDRLDAQHILTLMVKDDFPKIWVPSWENRDVRQLLWHRHRMVQTRTRIMNQLQAAALNEGLRYKKKLWRETGRQQLESLPLARWASRRRHDLLDVLDRINPTIAELTHAIEQEASSVSKPILVILVFWLTAIFISFGLFAPRNTTVMTSLFVAGLAVSGAIFLIMEMYEPFAGLIEISSAPLRATLTQLGQ